MRLLQRNNKIAPPPHSGIPETLPRLTAMIRGIGDPLVAAYARAYLCRVRRATTRSPLTPPPRGARGDAALPPPGGHGSGPPPEGEPEPQLLRPAGQLPADRRRERPAAAGAAEGGAARVPDALLARRQLDPAVHRLPSSRGTRSHTHTHTHTHTHCFALFVFNQKDIQITAFFQVEKVKSPFIWAEACF